MIEQLGIHFICDLLAIIAGCSQNGKTSLGDIIHRYIHSDQFSGEYLLDCLDLASDHHALEIANRVEAAICVWRRKMTSSKSSWGIVKELVSDGGDRGAELADRAESLLVSLKRRYPALPHTTLDTTKIQFNQDVGKSILESYSRVIGSVAFSIVARIDDLLYVDDLSKNSDDHFMSISKFGMITRNSTGIAPPLTGSPYRTGYSTCGHSPLVPISPAKGDRSPYIESSKRPLHGFGLRRVSTDCASGDGKRNELRSMRRLGLFSP